MRRITITAIVCLALSVFCIQTGRAQEEPVPCDPEPTDMLINYGDVITCSIDIVGDTDVFRFNGKKDEVVLMRVTRNSGSVDPCVELIAPNNDRVVACANSSSNLIDTTLDQTGTFGILISDYANNQGGAYALNLEKLIPPSIGSSKIDFGETIIDAINLVGDMDLFYFGGGTGDDIKARVTRNSGSVDPCVELIAPNNDRVVACANSSSNLIDTTLDQTGTFGILISDYANNQGGAYALNLQCLNPPCGPNGPPPTDIFCGGRRATIVGTDGHDFIYGTEGDDVIHGLGTSDWIAGMGGDDIICGGDGADFLAGVSGNDIIYGGDGHDGIWGGPGNDTLYGEDGHDTLYGGSGHDELIGGVGDDGLVGLAGNDILRGNFGNDTIYGGDGVDELHGGTGPNNGAIDNNDTCYDTAGTVKTGCEVFYVE